MLLVIDVGNTNTRARRVSRSSQSARGRRCRPTQRPTSAWWRTGALSTIWNHTVDEYGVLFRNLFAMDDLEASGIHGIIISSVVPPLDSTLRQVCERYFKLKPLFVEPGVKTGMPVQYENPAEVGADRIVNGVAAFERYGGPVRSGRFRHGDDVRLRVGKGRIHGRRDLSRDRNFRGCSVSAHSAPAPRRYPQACARRRHNTVGSLQSGLYYGYLGLVDGILERLLAEMGKETKVVATGGLASLIGTASKYIKPVDDLLTLEGLRIIWERNLSARPDAKSAAAKAGNRRQQRSNSAKPRLPLTSRVENYFNYFTEIEEHFQRRRGGILLLSTLDWALIETWKDAGIPLEAVCAGSMRPSIATSSGRRSRGK